MPVLTKLFLLSIFRLQTAPFLALGLGSKGQNSTLLEHAQVVYQIKGNHECSNMVSNHLSADLPSRTTLKMGSIGQNSSFSEQCHMAYQIKGNHECRNIVANICSKKYACRPPPTLTSGLGSKGQNSTLLEHAQIAYQIKGNH